MKIVVNCCKRSGVPARRTFTGACRGSDTNIGTPLLPTNQRFLPLADQRATIQQAGEIFRAFFASIPLSACAPGYRANQDTKTAWFEAGVRVVQGGPGERRAPSLDANGMLLTFRNVEMEPATETCQLENIVKQANDCLARGLPAIVSMHSINFHSTIRDFCTPALELLDDFLRALETHWPDLLYVNDGDLWHIATQGFFESEAAKITVAQPWPRPIAKNRMTDKRTIPGADHSGLPPGRPLRLLWLRSPHHAIS